MCILAKKNMNSTFCFLRCNGNTVTHTCTGSKWIRKVNGANEVEINEDTAWTEEVCNTCVDKPLDILFEQGLTLLCFNKEEPEIDLASNKYTVSILCIKTTVFRISLGSVIVLSQGSVSGSSCFLLN